MSILAYNRFLASFMLTAEEQLPENREEVIAYTEDAMQAKGIECDNRVKELSEDDLKALVEEMRKLRSRKKKKPEEQEEKLRSEKNVKQKNHIILEMNKFLSNIEADAIESGLPLDNMVQTLYNVKDYEVEFLLWYAVFIYYWFVEMMTFYTIFVWPTYVKDKQILSSIYSIIFGIVSEIQSQLSELYSNNKLSYESYSSMAIIAYYIKSIRDENLKPYFIYQYYALDMKSEINSIANSLLKLNEKIKNYNLMDMKDFESIGLADEILEVDKWKKVFLEWIEKSKNLTEIRINSPEYQHQSEMAMQAVKKIIQLQKLKS